MAARSLLVGWISTGFVPGRNTTIAAPATPTAARIATSVARDLDRAALGGGGSPATASAVEGVSPDATGA